MTVHQGDQANPVETRSLVRHATVLSLRHPCSRIASMRSGLRRESTNPTDGAGLRPRLWRYGVGAPICIVLTARQRVAEDVKDPSTPGGV